VTDRHRTTLWDRSKREVISLDFNIVREKLSTNFRAVSSGGRYHRQWKVIQSERARMRVWGMPPVGSRGKVLIGPGGFAPPPEADEYDNIKRNIINLEVEKW